jgi:hypothetical protein
MKTVKHRLYWNYEREEAWLNRMAAEGKALVRHTWATYTFEDCEKGEYIYRIERLDLANVKRAVRQYIDFMAENGVEHIATCAGWGYFRKKAAAGPFDLFSDLDSRLRHYERIRGLYITANVVMLISGAFNLRIGWVEPSNRALNGSLGCIALAFGTVFFFTITLPLLRKIGRLRKERAFHE